MTKLLNPIAKARLYRRLAALCGQESAAWLLRTSRPNLANTVRLLQLEPAIQRLLKTRRLSAGHARALLAVDDPDERVALAHYAVEQKWSVRRVEYEVASSHD